MNGKETYLNLLAGKPVDFIPRIPVLMRYAAEYIGSDYGAFAADHRVLVEANIRCAEDFGIDQMNTMSDPYRETEGFGATVLYSPDHGASLERVPLPDGVDLKLLQRPDPLRSTRMHDRLEAVKQYHARVGETHSIMGWVEGPAAEAADLRGVEDFFIELLTEPEALEELMDVCIATAIEFAQVQIAAGADTIGIGDAVASQVSPQIYEGHILPREQRLVAAIKQAGGKVRMHICGNITHLLPGLATLDLDVIDVDHMVSLVTARKVLGPRPVLGANLDPVTDILRGAAEGIREKLKIARDQERRQFFQGLKADRPAVKQGLLAEDRPRIGAALDRGPREQG